MPLGTEVGLVPGSVPRPRRHCVRWKPSSPTPQKRHSPQFSTHVYCGQTAVCIRIPLGTDVGLSLGDIVLDGDPAPLPKKGGGAPFPIFGPFLLWPNGWMHQDATWYPGRPQPRRLCVRWVAQPPSPKRGRSLPPNFRPMSIVAKRLDGLRCHLVRR